jgi:toxin ParE1/3/4
MILEWLPAAKQDFEEIVDYIAQDRPLAAVEQGDEILEQLSRLTSYPKMGHSGRVKGTRELVIARTPYIAAYRIKGEKIQILRILHGARQWPGHPHL